MRAQSIDWRLCEDRHGLERLRPAAMAFQFGLFFVGCLFWVEAALSGEAFSQDIYGELALSLPAEFWAFATMAGSAITINGLIRPMHRMRVAIGAGITLSVFAALSYSAAFTGGEFVIAVFASVMFATPHIWLVREGLRSDAG